MEDLLFKNNIKNEKKEYFLGRTYTFYEKKGDLSEKETLILSASDLKKIKKNNLLRLQQKKLNIIVDAKEMDYSDIRFLIEKKIPFLIYNFEYHKNKSFTYQPNSGIDNVLAKLMKKNSIKYGINISLFKKKISQNSFIYIRFVQNIKICKKEKVEIFPFSGEEEIQRPYEIYKSFFNELL